MRIKVIIGIVAYLMFDFIFIISNHFDYYGLPKPSYFIAWYSFMESGAESIWYGNDSTALFIFPCLIFLIAFCIYFSDLILKKILNYR